MSMAVEADEVSQAWDLEKIDMLKEQMEDKREKDKKRQEVFKKGEKLAL